ncbi:MAG TPA: SRPBCC domain-containing protein [Streptosporangiaceae bacterium]
MVSWVPAESLEFTWGWEHEPDEPPRTVLVRVSDDPPVLTIAHGSHASTPGGSRARASHRAGWEYLLPRLAALLENRVPAHQKPERADR